MLLFPYLPNNTRLDGELYIFGTDMNRISSIVKNEKTIHPDNHQMEYWLFDIMIPDKTTEERYDIIRQGFNACVKTHGDFKYIKFLLMIIVNNRNEIETRHDEYSQMGFEGLMIRRLGNNTKITRDKILSYYKGKRNNNLLKYKKFVNEECTVIGVTEGNGREKGLALFSVKDPRGNQFIVRPRGTFEQRTQWFLNPHDYIGKQYTIKRAPELSEYGVPRFPIGICFRDYE